MWNRILFGTVHIDASIMRYQSRKKTEGLRDSYRLLIKRHSPVAIRSISGEDEKHR